MEVNRSNNLTNILYLQGPKMFSFKVFLQLILYLINILRFSGSSGVLSGLAGTEARLGQACEGE